MGVVVLGQDGVSAISYYSMVYVFMTLVAFMLLALLAIITGMTTLMGSIF